MTTNISLIFYLLSFIVSAGLFTYGIRKHLRFFVAVSLIIPILIGGFRYGVGTDYFNYINLYNNHTKLSFGEFIDNNGFGELLFFTLEKIAYTVFHDPRFIFIISVGLTVIFFYFGIKAYKLKYPGLVYLLYLMTIFPMTLNAVRQGVAVSLVFFASTFILKADKVKYILMIIIAGLFHISALLLLPVYFLGRFVDGNSVKKEGEVTVSLEYMKYFIRTSFSIVVISLICLNVFVIIFSIPGFEKYELYLGFNEQGNNYIFFIKAALVILTVILSRRTVFKGCICQNKLLLLFAIVEVILLTLGFISPPVKREALYFSPFLLLILPNIIDAIKGNSLKIITYVVLALYGIAFFTISYYVLDQADIIPYNYSIQGEK